MSKAKCAYGEVTRNMVENFVKEFDNFKSDMKSEFQIIKKNQTELFNHQSSRIPQEVAKKMNRLYGLLGTIIGGTIVGVVVGLIMKFAL